MFWRLDPLPPAARDVPAKEARRDEDSDSRIAVDVLGDSTLVDRLMDCSKLPDSVTGVMMMTPGEGEIETLIVWETFRFAWSVLSPSTDHPTVPDSSTSTVTGDGGSTGGEGMDGDCPLYVIDWIVAWSRTSTLADKGA